MSSYTHLHFCYTLPCVSTFFSGLLLSSYRIQVIRVEIHLFGGTVYKNAHRTLLFVYTVASSHGQLVITPAFYLHSSCVYKFIGNSCLLFLPVCTTIRAQKRSLFLQILYLVSILRRHLSLVEKTQQSIHIEGSIKWCT